MVSTRINSWTCFRDGDESLRSTFPGIYCQLPLVYISSVTVKRCRSRKHGSILISSVTSLPGTGLWQSAPRRLYSSFPKSCRQSPALALQDLVSLQSHTTSCFLEIIAFSDLHNIVTYKHDCI